MFKKDIKISVLITFFFVYSILPFAKEKGCETFLGLKLGEATIKDVLVMMGPCNKVYLDSQEPESDAYGHSPSVIVFEYIKEISVVNKRQTAMISFIFDLSNEKVKRIIFEFSFARDINEQDIIFFFGKPDRVIHQPLIYDEDNIEGTALDCDRLDGEIESFLYIKNGLQVTLSPPDKYKIVEGKKVRLISDIYYDLDICTGKKNFPRCP